MKKVLAIALAMVLAFGTASVTYAGAAKTDAQKTEKKEGKKGKKAKACKCGETCKCDADKKCGKACGDKAK
jgi:hypothetical protein